MLCLLSGTWIVAFSYTDEQVDGQVSPHTGNMLKTDLAF